MPDSDEGSSPPPSPWKLRSRGQKRKADCDKAKKKPATSSRKKSKHDSVSVSPKHTPAVKEASDSKEIVVASSPPTKLPSYKAVVQLLAKPVREEEKSFTNRSGVEQKRIYLVYKCPNQFCKEKNREIWFQKSVGFINPFNHLKTCVAGGKTEQLYKIYEQNKESKRLHISGTFFQPSVDRMTSRELALNDYLRLIVLKSLPLSTVEDSEFRKFHRFNEKISRKVLKDTIFKLVDVVDKKLGEELKLAGKGSILHDGWTCAGVHYIALFACYLLPKLKKEGKEDGCEDGTDGSKVRLSLISVSPMARTEAADGESELEVLDETAVNFSARTHAEHIRNVFRYYDLDVETWAVCQTADNCSVNLKVADLLKIPHVGCKSHILNLEVNEMVKQNKELEGTLASIHETMSQCKKKLKNAALLRNLVSLVPILHNKTRWSGKLYMLERFLRIRDELVAVSEDENSDLQINKTTQFKNKVMRYCGYMKQINYSTKYMQTRKVTLAQCRDSLSMLIQDVEEGRNNRNSDMYRCPLGTKYIGEDAEIIRHKDFESGVCKIQNGSTELMTDEEKEACQSLLLETEEDSSSSDEEISYEERLRRRKMERENPSGFMDADFILGSAAEVERLWSIANNVLTDERKKTSPLLLEGILFLRVNVRLWDMQTVKQAYHMSRNDRVDRNIQEDEQHVE